MIKYALTCDKSHAFESWFKSSAAFDHQVARKLLACPVCGSAKVEKSIMAPAVAGGAKLERVEPAASLASAPEERSPVAILSPAERELRAKLKELREHLIGNSDYVGPRFADEARKMHYGEIDHRSIHGEASPDEATALAEEGIEFHPLPYLPDERN